MPEDDKKDEPGTTPPDAPPKDPPPDVKTFNQEQVNTFMADERRKLTDKHNKAITELTTKLDAVKISDEDRESLATQLENMQSERESEKQTLQRQVDKLTTDITKFKADSEAEVAAWKTRHINSLVERELTDAAVENLAIHPSQVAAILRPMVDPRAIIDTDTKKETGQYEGWIKGFEDVDEKGKTIVVDLKIADAIKRMRELPTKYGNLFETTAKSGVSLSESSPESDTTGSLDTILSMPPGQARSDKFRKFNEKNKGK